MPAIVTHSLTRQYGKITAVDHLDLTIEEGELFALLGVNGAGKSTAIRMLSCLTMPTAGDAWVAGHSVIHDSLAVKRVIGVSPQETAIAPNLTVRENLLFLCGVHGLTKAETHRRLAELTEQFSLHSVLNRPAGKLSGGWQRRLSIALALVSQPSVLFLDEPTLGLDVLARSELWHVIRTLKGHVTIILTTHAMEEAEALSDRIGVMKDGRLLVTGTAQELMAQTHTDRFEQAFIAIVKEGTV